jgi:membrane protein
VAQLWTDHPRVQELRKRSHTADVVVETAEGFRVHRTGRNAALLSHYGFLSVFPLFLVAATVLGFVLHGNPTLQKDILDSALNELPFVGQTIGTNPAALEGSVVVLVLGLATAVWASLRAFVGIQGALDDIAEVPLDDRPNLLFSRLRALRGIAVVGGGQIVTVVLASLAGVATVAVINRVLLVVAAVVVNTGVLAVSYRWLCSQPQTWRDVIRGAITAGVLFAALQVVGATVVQRAIAKASPVYGNFASVIALLSWLSLHALVGLGGAELNRSLGRDAAPINPQR